MAVIINILITAVAFYVGAKILSGVVIKDFKQALWVAIVVGILNFTLGTVLKVLTLGILSLTIFAWILNAIIILVADRLLPNFNVKNFWWAFGLAAIVSLVTGFLGRIFL
ncbi:MAG: phage holin family protein [Saprospiraceae bacterium]|nr:phage holin family protein [Saprospiraceae bacterium]